MGQSRIAILVPLRTAAAGAVHVDVTMPGDLLGRLDRFAAGLGMDRSGFIAPAARKAMDAA